MTRIAPPRDHGGGTWRDRPGRRITLPVRQVPRRREWPTDEQLVRRAQVGDHAASSLLVERHLSLGRRLALRYGNLGLSYDDLVQEGSIGLLEAIERYDRTRGAGFRTFAHWCVRRAM